MAAPIPPPLRFATGLRVASHPFHQHLLDALAPTGPTPLLWRSLSQWGELLRAGELEAVLLASVCPAPVEGMAWLPLGRWGLLLACRLNGPDSAAAPPPRTLRFLAPPVAAAPALHHALQEQQQLAAGSADGGEAVGAARRASLAADPPGARQPCGCAGCGRQAAGADRGGPRSGWSQDGHQWAAVARQDGIGSAGHCCRLVLHQEGLDPVLACHQH